MKLVTVSEMIAVEKEADANGLTYDMMMENAGHNLSREVMELAYYQDEEEDEVQVLGLVGPGNNGGDTLVALTHLAEKGWTARAYLVKRKAKNDPLVKRLEEAEGEIYLAETDEGFNQLQAFIENADVVLDGVLGTGFKLPLKADVGRVLEAAQGFLAGMEWPPFVVAVDCPSGMDCDSGQAAAQTIPADATVTMAAVKQGLLKLPAYGLAGELRLVDIGLLDELESWKALKNEVPDQEHVISILPERGLDAHKGTFGTAVIAAGSLNYTGAALLAGKAAYRVGAGLVTLAVPAPLHAALAGHFPEATWLLLPHEAGAIASSAVDMLAKNFERATTLLVGPGLGLEDTTKDFILHLLKSATVKSGGHRIGFIPGDDKAREDKNEKGLPPLVFDADGLKLLAKLPDWSKLLPAPAILTPHPGEMSALTGLPVDDIQNDRLVVAKKFAAEWGHVVVLKGAFTVVAAPDGRTSTIAVATPALARAGTGDVLSGLITGLRAQGMDAYDAAVAGAWIHAQAGLAAADNLGSEASVLAGDVLDSIPYVLSEL
jgi:ADP-dependent NAD(P)H-hydrate dehydratase / NAD(P)H-hydrate epimerase